MLEKLQNQTKHWTICHVKKKDQKRMQKALLERKESLAYSISCDSIYISHSVKDMIVQQPVVPPPAFRSTNST